MDGGFKIHALCFFCPPNLHSSTSGSHLWIYPRLLELVTSWGQSLSVNPASLLRQPRPARYQDTLQHLVFYFPLANCHGVYRWCLYNMMLEFLFRYVSIDSSHAPHVSRTEQRISSKRPPVWRRLCRLAIPQTPQVTTRSVQIGTAQDFTSAESSQQAKVKPNVSVECLDLAKFKNASVELRFCSGSDACVLTSKTVRC